MSAIVVDTHAAIWHVSNPSKLSVAARGAINGAAAAGVPVYVASISLVEICYLVDKLKLPQQVFDRIEAALHDPTIALRLVVLDHLIARNVALVSRGQVPDMPDRIIAATALTLGVPLVSRDRKIQASAIATIW